MSRPIRFIATNALQIPPNVCVCGALHRDAFPALHCLRRWREQRLQARCVLRGEFTEWPLEHYERIRGYCAALSLSVERDIPTLFAEHNAVGAQQQLPFESPIRSGAPWLTKANRYT